MNSRPVARIAVHRRAKSCSRGARPRVTEGANQHPATPQHRRRPYPGKYHGARAEAPRQEAGVRPTTPGGQPARHPQPHPLVKRPDETYEDWAGRVGRLSEEDEEQLLALDLDQLREMGVRCHYEEPPRRGASEPTVPHTRQGPLRAASVEGARLRRQRSQATPALGSRPAIRCIGRTRTQAPDPPRRPGRRAGLNEKNPSPLTVRASSLHQVGSVHV